MVISFYGVLPAKLTPFNLELELFPFPRLWTADSIIAIADAECGNLCLGHQSLDQMRPQVDPVQSRIKATAHHIPPLVILSHTHAWQSNGDALMCMSCGYLTIVNPSFGFVRPILWCCQVAICQASPANPSSNPRLGGVILICINILEWGGFKRSLLMPFWEV